MRQKALFQVMLLFGVLVSALPSYPYLIVQETNLADLIAEADIAVEGQVVKTEAQWISDERGKHIYTSATVRIRTQLKGQSPFSTLTVQVVGGTVGNASEIVTDMASFEKGEDVILFLKANPLRIVKGVEGKISVYNDKIYVSNKEISLGKFLQAIQGEVANPTGRLTFADVIGPAIQRVGQLPFGEIRITAKPVPEIKATELGGAPAVRSAGQVPAGQVKEMSKPILIQEVSGKVTVPAVQGSGQVSPGPARELADEIGAPSASGSGTVPATEIRRFDKPALSASGPVSPFALTATVYNAWWTNEIDGDGDGYKRSARLNWDPDVVGGSGSLSVYEKIYWKLASSSSWTFFMQTSAHTITGTSTSDEQYVNINGGGHNLYDWKIEIYRSGLSSPDYTRDPSNDTDLNDYKMETAGEDVALTATVYNAWWTNEIDGDGDGYKRSARLNWDPDVVGGSGSLSVYEKIYWKLASSSSWTFFMQTSAHTITGTSTSDEQYVGIDGGGHNLYDWKIEIYRSGLSSPDYTRDPSNDTDLNDYKMETAGEDVALTATVYNAWWTNEIDGDGDGYKRSARLNWDPDVVGGSGSLSVYEKIYWKLASSSSWTFFMQTSAHTITGTSTSDEQYVGIDGGGHNLYDWKIEIYRSGQSSPDYTRDPSNDTDLNDYKMETAGEDVTATVYNAWWTNEVDSDGDGYKRSARLNWDPDVVGGSGSLSVYEKIYWKLASSSSWTFAIQTSLHTITGTSTSDQQYADVTGGAHNLYDFKIEIYRSGVSSPDYARDPSNDPDLNDYKMETAQEDTGGPIILSVSPSQASAGTDSQVTVTGSGFGATQGSSKVEFWYGRGQTGDPPKITAPIVSWSDTRIVCSVPVGTLNGYRASAGSGPVTVTTAETSNGYMFKVTFGYGLQRWAVAAPVVSYRINENTADCTGEGAAVQSAADTWNSAGSALTFRYAGTHPNTVASQNGVNEIMWGSTAGSLASTYIWPVSGDIVECDIVLNDTWNWSTASQPPSGRYDVQSVVLHELGHWLFLRDLYGDIGDNVYDTAKVMYGRSASATTKRNLHADDRAGLLWIYANHTPQLSNGRVSPTSGNTNTDFYWYVDYYDQDGDAATLKQVVIDGSAYTMSLYSGSSWNGTYRYGPKKLSAGPHSYRFSFTDGMGGSAALPASGSFSGPTVSGGGPTITVTDPYAGVIWPAGTFRSVAWTCSNFPGSGEMLVELWKGGRSYAGMGRLPFQNGNNISSVLLARWVPSGSDYQIRLYWTQNVAVQGHSAVFSVIGKPTIQITWPTSGASWQRSKWHDVTWTCHDIPASGQMIMELWKGGRYLTGMGRKPFQNGSNSSHEIIPFWLSPGSDYQVRLFWTQDLRVQAASGTFTVY